MLQSVTNYLYEFARCARHNLLHLQTFRLAYRRGRWRVRDDDGVEMWFNHYPYLTFQDIEGYLFKGRWKPQPGETVLDVGAFYGEYALYASRRVGSDGRVLMLEPDPASIAVAKDLFALNGNPSNIEIVPAGLWSSEGMLRFTAGQGQDSRIVNEGSVAARPDAGEGRMIEIPTHTLASLVLKYGLKRLDLVKMDIEGAEVEAISVADQLPPHLRPRYAIASYHMMNGRRTADTLEELFPKLGYHCRTGNPRHLTTYASPAPLD
jgi:FkbM family methyltransferase